MRHLRQVHVAAVGHVDFLLHCFRPRFLLPKEHPFYCLKPAEAGRGPSLFSGRRDAPAEAESGIALEVLREDVPRGREFFANESHPKEPCAHREFGILALRLFGAGALEVFGLLAQCKAKLDVAFDFPCMDAAFALLAGVRELEAPEFDRSFREGGVEVQHVVAASVVVCVALAAKALHPVPNVGKLVHLGGLLLVEGFKETLVDRAAVAADAAMVKAHRGNQQAFMASHEVCKIAEGLGCMPRRADVDVHPAHVAGVAFCPRMAQAPQQPLQKFDVLVMQDGRYQFALLAFVRGIDADVALEFPFAPLCVPCAPCAVSVARVRVLEAAGAEVLGCRAGGCSAADAVHLDLYPNRLCLHALNLPCRCFFHFLHPRFRLLCLSFWYVHISL